MVRHPAHGAAGLRHHVARHVELARGLGARLDADPRFELVRPVDLSLVCVRATAGDEAGEAIMEAINRSGRALLSHTRVDGRFVLRISVGQTTTEQGNVDALWELLDAAADGRTITPRPSIPTGRDRSVAGEGR